jgi:hypothetical protein
MLQRKAAMAARKAAGNAMAKRKAAMQFNKQAK